MTAPITFHGSEMVATLAAPEARRRLLPVDDNAIVLTADRLTLAPRLPCHECVREPVCYIRRSISPHALDAILPPQIHPALTISVTADAVCELFVPEDVLSADAGWPMRAVRYATAALLGVVFTAAALLSGIVQMNPR